MGSKEITKQPLISAPAPFPCSAVVSLLCCYHKVRGEILLGLILPVSLQGFFDCAIVLANERIGSAQDEIE